MYNTVSITMSETNAQRTLWFFGANDISKFGDVILNIIIWSIIALIGILLALNIKKIIKHKPKLSFSHRRYLYYGAVIINIQIALIMFIHLLDVLYYHISEYNSNVKFSIRGLGEQRFSFVTPLINKNLLLDTVFSINIVWGVSLQILWFTIQNKRYLNSCFYLEKKIL